ELETLTGREAEDGTVTTTNEPPEKPAVTPQADEEFLAQVRQQAIADAIETGRRGSGYYEQAQSLSPEQIHFTERVKEIAGNDLPKLLRDAQAEGTDLTKGVHAALLVMPGGPEAAIYLLRNAEDRRKLASMPEYQAVAAVGFLAARLTQPQAKRAISSAPPPIKPVGGSATRSSIPLDETDYQTYARIRNNQEKMRFRR